MPKAQLISVIVPAKNEEHRLPVFLKSLIAYCLKSRLDYEIIVVDDGSTDDTAGLIPDFQRSFPALTLIKLDRNHGKGYAVKQGMLASRGDIALFMDADGSTPAEEIEVNLKFFDEGYDIVIGSRVLASPLTKVETKFYRKAMGWIFNFLVSSFLIKGIKDTQCGFKMFSRRIIKPLWENTQLEGFGFDLEVLFLAQRMGCKIKEIAVNWKHVDHSKINVVRDSLRMLMNIFQIRKIHRNL